MSQKKPLPGYRFFFNLFGGILIILACWLSYDLIAGEGGKSGEQNQDDWVVCGMIFVWLAVGIIFIWYARILATADLTMKHWKLGWFLIPLGLVTGYGIIFLFMLLIWGDADVKANFNRPKNET